MLEKDPTLTVLQQGWGNEGGKIRIPTEFSCFTAITMLTRHHVLSPVHVYPERLSAE